MKYIIFTLTVLMVFPAQAMEKVYEIEISRLENQINKLQASNKQFLKDIRALQRTNEDNKKDNDKLLGIINDMSDEILGLRNNDISNLKSAQQKLYKSLPILDWGNQQRGCKSIDSKHQQIKSVTRNDGALTVRYLCFDGQVLHLGTEVNTVP